MRWLLYFGFSGDDGGAGLPLIIIFGLKLLFNPIKIWHSIITLKAILCRFGEGSLAICHHILIGTLRPMLRILLEEVKIESKIIIL